MTHATDRNTLVFELKDKVKRFIELRDWVEEHDGKNLAMCIAIEAAELMEHFQWKDRAEYAPELISPSEMQDIKLEVADVMIYLLSFCRHMGIDLAEAVYEKIAINETRFPVKTSSSRE